VRSRQCPRELDAENSTGEIQARMGAFTEAAWKFTGDGGSVRDSLCTAHLYGFALRESRWGT
jgi:hypothetical protein